jgi:hypothetical protein
MNVGQPGLTQGRQPMAAAKAGVPQWGTVAARKDQRAIAGTGEPGKRWAGGPAPRQSSAVIMNFARTLLPSWP